MVEGIEHVLDFVAILFWAIGICQVKIGKEKIRWVITFGSMIGIAIIQNLFQNEEEFLIRSVLMIIGYVVLVHEKWQKKLAVYLFSIFYVSILYEAIELLFKVIIVKRENEMPFLEVLEVLIVIFCIIFLAYEIRKRKEWMRWIERIPNGYYLFGFICAFSATGITTYININMEYNSRKIQIMVTLLLIIANIFLYLIGIGTAFIDLLRRHYKRESILKDEYLYFSKCHYESMSEKIKEMQALKHDMKAHLNAITHFIEKEEIGKLSEYIEITKKTVEMSMEKMIDVNHDLVNAILTENLANKEDILFEYEGIIPNNVIIEDFDLCIIFSNLLSNSIEACEKLKNLKRRIVLQIKRFQNNLIIYIENPVEKNIDVEKLGEWTTKDDKINHGYGIYNVIKAVEKYNGEITFNCENYKFSVEIIFLNILEQPIIS